MILATDVTRDLNEYGVYAAVGSIWCEVLQRPQTPEPGDNFFGVGGDSLAMMSFLFRLQEELRVELSPAALMDARDFDDIRTTVWKLLCSDSTVK